jgi:tetratricopeptide (TPR) repeat protein
MDALNELYKFAPKDTLQNSVRKAIERVRALRTYPEADFWIGETFKAEGELGIALKQYKKAYEARDLLEVPDEARTILYRMAEVHSERQEYNEMEARLLDIVAADPLWADDANNFLRESLDRSLSNEGVDQVLSLYRMDAVGTSQAHRMLGFQYYATGRHDRAAAHLTFAFVIQTTAIIDELKRIDLDWRFTNFRAILDAARKRESLAEYCKETEYFKTCYFLAASLYAVGKQAPAFELWRILSTRQEAGEWRIRSSRQLAKPTVEKAVEAP